MALAFTMVAAGVVIAPAWFWYRPLIGLAVLVVGLVAGFFAHRLAANRGAGRPAAA